MTGHNLLEDLEHVRAALLAGDVDAALSNLEIAMHFARTRVVTKPIILTISESTSDPDGDVDKHRYEITVDDGRAEIRNMRYCGRAERGPHSSLTVGLQPLFVHLGLEVEVAP